MPKTLTESQVRHFREEGWLAPFRVMDREKAKWHFDQVERFEKQYGYDSNAILKVKSHLVLPWIVDLARNPKILDVVEDLIGPNIRLFGSSIFAKGGMNHTYVSWHQDSAYFGLTPNDLVTAWVGFSDSNRQNGCLRVLPRSHIGENRKHVETYAKDNLLARGQTILDIDESKVVEMEVEAGQFSVHHEKMAHSSNVNSTPHRRIGFAFFFIPTHVKSTQGRRGSLLVRGVDTYGYWDDDREPETEMDPEGFAALEKIWGTYRDGEVVKQAAVAEAVE